MHTKSLQSHLTLCNPVDCNPPGSSSVGFSRQEYWSGLPCPPPGDLPDPGIKPVFLMSPALAGRFFTSSAIWDAQFFIKFFFLITEALSWSFVWILFFCFFIFLDTLCLHKTDTPSSLERLVSYRR